MSQPFGGSWWIRKPRSKKQPAGLFFAACGRPTCSNPTSSSTKKDPQPKLRIFFGGSWWIRTTEALSSRFTVCPHWPLGKAPIFICCPVRTARVARCLIIIAKRHRKCKPFFQFFYDFFKKVYFKRCCAQKLAKGERPAGVERGAAKGCSVLEYRRRIVIYK